MGNTEKLEALKNLLNDNNVLKGYLIGIILNNQLDSENPKLNPSDRRDWLQIIKALGESNFEIVNEQYLQLNDNNDNLIIISRTITPEIDLQMEVKKINIPEIGNFFIWYY